MARSINEAVEIEEKDEHEFLDVGPRNLTPFERERLAFDPTLPIYISFDLQNRLDAASSWWRHNVRKRSKAVPATCTREFVRSEGSL